jgi:hypothetical protein
MWGDLALAATQLGQTALRVQENLARRPSTAAEDA